MARFYGNVGFAVSEELRPGVSQDVITERPYGGNVIDASVRHEGDKVIQDLTTGISISIVADPYAFETYHAMKYVVMAGVKWSITNVDERYPRLILRLGGVYNGPTPISP